MHVAIADARHLDAAYAVIADCREALEARGILQWDAHYPSRAFFAEAIAANTLFVLFDEEFIVGVAVLDNCQPPEWSSAAWALQGAPYLVIHAFAVSPRFQRRGDGNFLLAFCEDAARQRGAKAIRIDAFAENSVALRFCECHGYALRGESSSRPSRLGTGATFVTRNRWEVESGMRMPLPSKKRAVARRRNPGLDR